MMYEDVWVEDHHSPTFGKPLTGTMQKLRRMRVTHGRHREWVIVPRYGTGSDDRWTLLSLPRPADGNPAVVYEDGQFARLADAYAARDLAERHDNGGSL